MLGRYICGREDVLDGLGDLRTDTVTFDQSDCVFSLLATIRASDNDPIPSLAHIRVH